MSVCCIFQHTVARIALEYVAATLTLDTTVANGTIVAFISLVALFISLSAMWLKERLVDQSTPVSEQTVVSY
jgi:hypothetical protein